MARLLYSKFRSFIQNDLDFTHGTVIVENNNRDGKICRQFPGKQRQEQQILPTGSCKQMNCSDI